MAPRERLGLEIERLEGRLDRATDARAIGELATVRRGLASDDPRAPGIELPNLRLGFKCKERWEDMVGSDRVRACGGCDRPVFNLSAMTRAEAEAVLATRGLTPCVRFYRRPDGTVMTTDCPTGTRPVRKRLAVVASSMVAASTTLVSGAAFADPWVAAQPGDPETPTDSQATDPPAPEATDPEEPGAHCVTAPGETIEIDGAPVVIQQDSITMGIPISHWEMGDIVETPRDRPAVEWSVWTRLGVGIASPRQPDVASRQITPQPPIVGPTSIWEGAATADLTFRAGSGDLRLGVFGELRTTSDPVVGGELVLEGLPPHPYGSNIGGTGNIVVRVGANDRLITTALGFGYVGSYPRSDPWIPWLRHMVGGRVIVTTNHSLDEPGNWSATLGLEVEPSGVVRALFDSI